MINDNYNEKAQKLKITMGKFIKSEREWVKKRAKMINFLIAEFDNFDEDTRTSILNLKKIMKTP